MPKNTSVSLGDHFSEFVDEQVAEGRFNSASDVIRAGLRLLEEHELRVRELRNLLIEGIESGEPRKLNRKALMKSLRARNG